MVLDSTVTRLTLVVLFFLLLVLVGVAHTDRALGQLNNRSTGQAHECSKGSASLHQHLFDQVIDGEDAEWNQQQALNNKESNIDRGPAGVAFQNEELA